MWRFRAISVIAAFLGVFLFGTTVALAGWDWNSKIDVEGTVVRTVWTVGDDPDNPDGYTADIRVSLPKGADAQIVERASNEKVTLQRNDDLSCSSNGVESEVKIKVDGIAGSTGRVAKLDLVTLDGRLLGTATGAVGDTLRVNGVIPADSPSCQ